jgi:hypothetical protein
MRRNLILDALSRRAPTIVVITLCIALVAYWLGAPRWLPYGLAVAVGSIAIVVVAARDRRGQFKAEEELDSTKNESWIAHELAGNGSPPGSYLLGFCGLVTIILTGFQGAYALPAWAGLALAAAWGVANAHHPSDEGSSR